LTNSLQQEPEGSSGCDNSLQNTFKKGDMAVAEVELTQDVLIVHVQGTDQLWALKSRLEIPSPTWWVPRRIVIPETRGYFQ
jgi:hypothetical protein